MEGNSYSALGKLYKSLAEFTENKKSVFSSLVDLLSNQGWKKISESIRPVKLRKKQQGEFGWFLFQDGDRVPVKIDYYFNGDSVHLMTSGDPAAVRSIETYLMSRGYGRYHGGG